jgi:transcription antitermination factor NusG
MWYVMQVRTGTEESVRRQCEKMIDSNTLTKCFIPYQERLKRYRGQWHKELMPLFPGYVFADSQDADSLFFELKRIAGLTKLLGTGDMVIALTQDETNFLKQVGKEKQIVAVSKGIIINSQVTVAEGPLKGLEGYIRRVDRHRRIAWLELSMFGRVQRVTVGLEIMEKRKTEIKRE